MSADLDDFRRNVRAWCREHVPTDWRHAQTGVTDDQFVAFQKSWFAELHTAGYAVPQLAAEVVGIATHLEVHRACLGRSL